MRILGISAFYHDSAAALIDDGHIISAAQEERFSRKKQDSDFPGHALAYCLAEAKCQLDDVDFVAFYDKPFLKFERLLETYLAFAPKGFSSFAMAVPVWLKEKLFQKHLLRDELKQHQPDFDWENKLLFAEHHQSHAASAFFPSPFDDAVVLTMDGVGEWATTSVGVGQDSTLEMVREIHFPHSLGLLYSAFTYYTGFRVNSGEYKVMGLAPYGEPRFKNIILNNLIDLKEDGSFRLNMEYFDYYFISSAINTIYLAILSGIFCVAISVSFNYLIRVKKNNFFSYSNKIISSGYGVPGVILALGVLELFSIINIFSEILLIGSVAGLILVYTIKFYALPNSSIESGYRKINTNIDEAAKTLGAKKIEILRKIHFPMLRNSGLVALLLISIEVIKELPATLVLRPFNFDTLSISAYIYASDERMVEAAAPSIGIVLISLIPILLLIKILDKDKNE